MKCFLLILEDHSRVPPRQTANLKGPEADNPCSTLPSLAAQMPPTPLTEPVARWN